MPAKRVLGELLSAEGGQDLLVQAHRFAFEGADELWLRDGGDAGRLRDLVTHLDLPLVVEVDRPDPVLCERLLGAGATRVVVPWCGAEGLAALVHATGGNRLGISLPPGGPSDVDSVLTLLETCPAEVLLPEEVLLDARQRAAFVCLPLNLVATGGRTPLEGAVDWMLSGGDGWLIRTDGPFQVPDLKRALVGAAVRVRI